MSFVNKIDKAYKCIEDFKTTAGEEINQFINVIFPLLYKSNKGNLTICTGKKTSKKLFMPWLSALSNDFTISLSNFKGEPTFVFKDNMTHSTFAAINLAMVKNIEIDIEEGTYVKYHISFNYNDEVDYDISITIK